MNFYKHYIGDFQRDTGHLSLTERGAYLCLIHHYYATEKPLPNDLDALCRIAGAVSKIERAAVKVVIGFFEPVASGLMSVRIEAELEKAGEISNTNRDIALAREAKRRAKKDERIEHEQSTLRAQSVPRTEHEQSTNQTPDTRVNHSEANASGGKPPKVTDPDEIIFGYGVPLLTNSGTAENQARSFLGGLRKAHGDAALIDKLRDCAKAKPLQPLEWLAAALPPTGSSAPKRNQPSPENFATKDYGIGGRL